MPENQDDRVEQILKHFDDIQGQRKNYDSHCQEIVELVWPHAGDFIGDIVPGVKRSQRIYDATASMALEKFSAVLESVITPRQQEWHEIRAGEEELNKDYDVQVWLGQVNRILFQERAGAKAGFYSAAHVGYKSLGAFGGDCLFVDDRVDRRGVTRGLRYMNSPIATTWMATDENGIPDTIYRKIKYTAKQAEQKWGPNLPEKIRDSMTSAPLKKWPFLHMVVPNDKWNPENPLSFQFTSLYISIEDKKIVDEGGYHDNPFMYSRYTVMPDEDTGRGPAMVVFPAINMLQEMQRVFIRSGHKVGDPPLLLHNPGILGRGSRKVRLNPGGLNYGALDSQGRELIKPLHTGARLDITGEMRNDEREVVNDAFLISLFQILVDRPQQTATEALLRAQEKGQLLAPTVGRQQSEKLGPMVEREINALLRQGRIPEPPPAFMEAGGELDIRYESPAMRFQRSEDLIGVQRTLEMARPFAEVEPRVMRMFDSDKIIRLAAEINGAPADILHSPERVAEMAAEDAQQDEQARKMAQIEQAGGAAKDIAGAVGQLPQGQAA